MLFGSDPVGVAMINQPLIGRGFRGLEVLAGAFSGFCDRLWNGDTATSGTDRPATGFWHKGYAAELIGCGLFNKGIASTNLIGIRDGPVMTLHPMRVSVYESPAKTKE